MAVTRTLPTLPPTFKTSAPVRYSQEAEGLLTGMGMAAMAGADAMAIGTSNRAGLRWRTPVAADRAELVAAGRAKNEDLRFAPLGPRAGCGGDAPRALSDVLASVVGAADVGARASLEYVAATAPYVKREIVKNHPGRCARDCGLCYERSLRKPSRWQRLWAFITWTDPPAGEDGMGWGWDQ